MPTDISQYDTYVIHLILIKKQLQQKLFLKASIQIEVYWHVNNLFCIFFQLPMLSYYSINVFHFENVAFVSFEQC